MKNRGVGKFLIAAISLFFTGLFPTAQTSTAQTSHQRGASRTSGQSVSAHMQVVPDLERRLARFRQVHMPFDASGLTAREQKMTAKLVDACRYLDDIYWRQVDPDGLQLYQALEGKTSKQDVNLRRYLWINGSRFDLLDGQKPFVGATPMPLGRGFYPQGLTRDQIEQYVRLHPEKRAELYSPTSVVRWHGSDLEGLPYHIAYRSFLEPAASDLREAADLSPDKAFANFLRLRAEALLSDDYFQSDIVWMQLKIRKLTSSSRRTKPMPIHCSV